MGKIVDFFSKLSEKRVVIEFSPKIFKFQHLFETINFKSEKS